LQTAHNFVDITKVDIIKIMKIIQIGPPPILISFLAEKRLTVFTYWVNRCHHLRESIDPNLFTPVALQAFMKIMERGTQEGDSTAVKAPEDFKAGSKWKVFKESAIAYFNSVHTKGGIPLAYMIREQVHNDADDCEHTCILRALVKYPKGNLEEIQEKTLRSTQKEPGGRQDRKALAYATEHYAASRTASANTGEAICTRVLTTSPPRPPL
jgi:hypothetical protein